MSGTERSTGWSRWRTLVLAGAIALAAAGNGLAAEANGNANGRVDGKLMGDLPAVMAAAAPGEKIPVYFVLADQLEGARLQAAAAVPERLGTPRSRRPVIAALQAHAARTQAGLVARLREVEASGRAARIRPLWIGNVVAADLTARDIEALAARPEVARVNWSPKRDVWLGTPASPVPPLDPFGPQAGLAGDFGPQPDEIECGTNLMQAPRVWNELGNTGAGAVIAVVDSGVCWTHPDIVNQIWVNPGEDLNHNGVVMDAADMNGVDDDGNGHVDDLIGWDFDQNDNQPSDDNSHGSHCAGSVAGDGTSGTQAGVAPDAKIMVVRVGLQFTDEPDVWAGMQYAAQNGADSISMSLGWPHNQNPDRATWRTNCENTIDAGTAMVIAAGNEGSGAEPDNVRTPGDVPRVITVGALDCSDVAAGFSSRGPVSWSNVPPFNDHPFPPGLVKPDVSGPGVDTKSHNVCSGYSFKSGTSMATPHVAGAVALMKSANPGLTHDDVKQILQDTSVDLGDPGMDNTFGTGRVDAYEAVLLCASSDGRVAIREVSTACAGGVLHITVSDADLKGAGSLAIKVTSGTEPLGEMVTLTESGNASGAFKGEVTTAPGAPAPDGVVQVGNGDTIVATYVDADDGEGGTNVVKTDSALTDCSAPVISNVRTEQIGLTSARVRWTTDEAGSSVVEYGTTPALGLTATGGFTTAHDVPLTGLTSCTVYYYRVKSTDGVGNPGVADNGGAMFRFETYADFGSGPQSCHGGRARLDRDVYSCADTVTLEVSDLDLNGDAGVADTAVLLVSSTTEATPETIVVTETGPNTSRFQGTILTASGAPVADGKLQTANRDTLTVSYLDADDGTGSFNTSYDTALLDCTAPRISSLRIEGTTDQRFTVRYTTDEPSNTVIEYGPTPALGQTVSSTSLVTEHAAVINRFEDCDRVYFRVRSTDTWGYEASADRAGTPFATSLGTIPGLYWRETFESGVNGWTLGGEWQVGAPQGKGGSSGLEDPVAAYNNNGILGHDLTGLGSFPGDYETGRTDSARSPIIPATTWQRTKLLLYRRLNSGPGDDAQLWLLTASGVPIYRSQGQPVSDFDYSLQTFDVASRVDGQPGVRLDFRQTSDAGGQYSGWNVDDVIFKDGALPDYAQCGQCGGAPSFAGAASATDDDACGATGVTVRWAQAVSWGSGTGGTYSIWRDTTPGFTPTNANRIATGLTALAFTDASAPAGVPVYYLVRAENNEACGGGPANGGVPDDNAVYVPATNGTTQPAPGAITALGTGLVAHTHVRLSWPAAPAATLYRVFRSAGPQPAGFAEIGETAALVYDDAGEGTTRSSWFYLVRGVNACGTEGP